MRTKSYTFTDYEICAIRNALIDYWHNTSEQILEDKHLPECTSKLTDFATKVHTAVGVLREQFKRDFWSL